MGYNIFDSCMLFPGFSRAECAAWVQAWGSIAAICAAIYVALWQRIEERRHKLSGDMAAARTVCGNLQLILVPAIGLLISIRNRLTEKPDDSFASHQISMYLEIVRELPVASQTQLLILSAVQNPASIVLSAACSSHLQSQLILKTLETQYRYNIEPNVSQRTLLSTCLSNTIEGFQVAANMLTANAVAN